MVNEITEKYDAQRKMYEDQLIEESIKVNSEDIKTKALRLLLRKKNPRVSPMNIAQSDAKNEDRERSARKYYEENPSDKPKDLIDTSITSLTSSESIKNDTLKITIKGIIDGKKVEISEFGPKDMDYGRRRDTYYDVKYKGTIDGEEINDADTLKTLFIKYYRYAQGRTNGMKIMRKDNKIETF